MRLVNDKPYYAREVELPFSAIYDRRVLMEGINAAECEQHCGNVIEWQEYHEAGPEPIQAQGFQCDSCGEWSCCECGIREVRICWSCIRQLIRDAFRDMAESA